MQQSAHKLSETLNVDALPSIEQLEALHERILAIAKQATAHIPPAKIQDKVSDFLDFLYGADVDCPNNKMRAMDALGYAVDVCLFTPSMSGQTATDRLMRSGKITTADDRKAATFLCNSVFRLIEFTGDRGEGFFDATDLASDEELIVFNSEMFYREGARWALRTCFYEGVHMSVDPVTPLDDTVMEAAQPFIVKGRGLKNPLRCAEAIYRTFVRYGNPIDGINSNIFEEEFPFEEEEFPFNAENGPLHALAFKWLESDVLPEPSPDELRLIRSEAYVEPVFKALNAYYFARGGDWPRHAAAYERILVIQLETIHRRSGAGIRTSHETLDGLATELRQSIAAGKIPPDVVSLFDDLCRRAKLACSAKTANKTSRDELDKVLARIQALRSKTMEQGCTEAEALLAAGKVAELLDRYGLSLSEVEIKEQSCSGEGIETNRRRRSSLDDCVGTIANFCDCRSWIEMTASGNIRHIFFGLPADVAGARVLYEKVEEAFDTETRNFKRGDLYDSHSTGNRRNATASFQLGLGDGICTKLNKLKEARTATAHATGGRDLVPIKNSVIEDELANLGLDFRSIHSNRGKNVLSKAYHSGRITGENLDWEERIEA